MRPFRISVSVSIVPRVYIHCCFPADDDNSGLPNSSLPMLYHGAATDTHSDKLVEDTYFNDPQAFSWCPSEPSSNVSNVADYQVPRNSSTSTPASGGLEAFSRTSSPTSHSKEPELSSSRSRRLGSHHASAEQLPPYLKSQHAPWSYEDFGS